MKFRTYGTSVINKEYDYSKRQRYDDINKPTGLWASPIDGEYRWDDWCLMEGFNLGTLHEHVDFTLKLNTRILKLRNEKEFDRAYKKYGYIARHGIRCFNWKQIEKDYDAVLFYMSGFDSLRSEYYFNLWDVDSLVVFNLEKIKC